MLLLFKKGVAQEPRLIVFSTMKLSKCVEWRKIEVYREKEKEEDLNEFLMDFMLSAINFCHC